MYIIVSRYNYTATMNTDTGEVEIRYFKDLVAHGSWCGHIKSKAFLHKPYDSKTITAVMHSRHIYNALEVALKEALRKKTCDKKSKHDPARTGKKQY